MRTNTDDATPVLPSLPSPVAHIELGDDSEDVFTAEQMHAFRQDGIGHAMIQVEKLLCELLGREWSAVGMSVDSLARELAARRAIESLSRAPIDMVLHCPNCGEQHIDAPDWHNDPHEGAVRFTNAQQRTNPLGRGEA